MTQPLSLASYYDALMRHDWAYDRSDDHAIWSKGDAEFTRLNELARTSPEHRQLFDDVSAFQFDPEEGAKPARPAENAPFTVAPPKPAPDELSDLDEADRASVKAARDPAARLREIYERQALDERVSFEATLRTFGASQDTRNASRWTFPDGTVAMVKMERKVWVEQKTMTIGQGATALVSRLTGQPEAEAMRLLRTGSPSSSASAQPVAPSPAPETVSVPTPAAPSVSDPAPEVLTARRFVRRGR